MIKTLNSYTCRYFDIYLDTKHRRLRITLKGRWTLEVFELFKKKINVYLQQINASRYMLELSVIELAIYIPELKFIIEDFMAIYTMAGFKYLQLYSMPPQKELRHVVRSCFSDKNCFIDLCGVNNERFAV